jgi:hypothetical protein
MKPVFVNDRPTNNRASGSLAQDGLGMVSCSAESSQHTHSLGCAAPCTCVYSEQKVKSTTCAGHSRRLQSALRCVSGSGV